MLCDIIENAKAEREELIEQGVAQGVAQGKQEGMIEAAKNMLAEGFPVELIVRLTKLTKEDVERIPAL